MLATAKTSVNAFVTCVAEVAEGCLTVAGQARWHAGWVWMIRSNKGNDTQHGWEVQPHSLLTAGLRKGKQSYNTSGTNMAGSEGNSMTCSDKHVREEMELERQSGCICLFKFLD